MTSKKQLLKIAKPILFNTEMVNAILSGRKTQTRRVIKNEMTIQPEEEYKYSIRGRHMLWNEFKTIEEFISFASIYKKGDVIYVRETILQELNSTLLPCGDYSTDWGSKVEYVADGAKKRFLHKNSYDSAYMAKRPSIHMPKKYARIFLKVTNICVEELQDITDMDIQYEGIKNPIPNMLSEYSRKQQRKFLWKNLWNSTSKKGHKWEDNPYVFVYKFEKIEGIK